MSPIRRLARKMPDSLLAMTAISTLLFSIPMLLLMVDEVLAACSDTAPWVCYGRDTLTGYHTGNSMGDNTYVFTTGSASGDSALPGLSGDNNSAAAQASTDEFISIIRGHLNTSSTGQNSVGASFIVNTMLGVDGTNFTTTSQGINNADARFDDWESRVRFANDRGCVNWDVPRTFGGGGARWWNSAYSRNASDAGFFGQKESDSQQTIVIREVTGSGCGDIVFEIRKNCANPAGVLGVLTEAEEDSSVEIHRVPTGNLSASNVNSENVRVRQPADGSNFNQLAGNGSSYLFPDVPDGTVNVASSSNTYNYYIRIRTRICDGDGSSCGSWSSWTAQGSAYQSTSRTLPLGQRLVAEIEYREPDPPDHSTAVAECTTASGSINLDYDGTASVRFKAWIAGTPEPGWQQSNWYGSGYGESESYSFTVPNSAKDAYRDTRIRIRHMYSPRSDNNHDAFNGSVGPCGDYFDYHPLLDLSVPESPNPKPGHTIVVNPSVENRGEDRSGGGPRRGESYNYQLRITSGASNLVGYSVDSSQTVTNVTRAGILTGATDNLGGTTPREFTIKDDAPDGAEVCFRTRVEPTQGQTWPTRYLRSGVNQVRFSPEQCFNVYNVQFELSDISISGDTDYVTPPGDGASLNINVNLVNNGDVNSPPAPINNSGAIGGITNGIVTTLEVYSRTPDTNWGAPDTVETSNTQVSRGAGGETSLTYNHDISNETREDVMYCFVAYANPTSGWSDGSNWNHVTAEPAPFYDTPTPINTGNIDDCQYETRVTTQSYFQVHRNDIHSGIAFAPPESPLRGCEQPDSTRGFISAPRTNDYGSLSEYAAYATGAIPVGNTDGFGTSATSTGSSLAAENFFTSDPMIDRLTFANANNPIYGHLGADAYRCLSSLFDMLEKGDVPQVSGTLNNFQGSTDPTIIGSGGGDRQVYAAVSDLIIDAQPVSTRRTTIIVDGDVNIDNNIRVFQQNTGRHQGGNVVIIARGDIRISEDVDLVEAMLFAMPREDGTGGALDTCYEHESLGTDVCGEQLTINGLVIADRLDLKRTHGGISGGRDEEPAEVFRFNPLYFFHPPYFVFGDNMPRPDLKVQQMIDLPPRF